MGCGEGRGAGLGIGICVGMGIGNDKVGRGVGNGVGCEGGQDMGQSNDPNLIFEGDFHPMPSGWAETKLSSRHGDEEHEICLNSSVPRRPCGAPARDRNQKKMVAYRAFHPSMADERPQWLS